MRAIICYLRSLIDSKSANSASRFLSIITVLNVLYVWEFVSIWNRRISEIPNGVNEFVAIVVIGRTAQSFGEYWKERKEVKRKEKDAERCEDAS